MKVNNFTNRLLSYLYLGVIIYYIMPLYGLRIPQNRFLFDLGILVRVDNKNTLKTAYIKK